jgi:hypothetical protein
MGFDRAHRKSPLVDFRAPSIFILLHEHSQIKQDGTDRSRLGRERPYASQGRPVLPLRELEQLPGLISPHHVEG